MKNKGLSVLGFLLMPFSLLAATYTATEQYVDNKVAAESNRTDKAINELRTQIEESKYLTPDSILAGDNVSVTTNADGTVTISSIGGGEETKIEAGENIWFEQGSEEGAIVINATQRNVSIDISVEDLNALQHTGGLATGSSYRITNYVATTNGDMSSRSANHPFDIIVVADATNKLNETARAIRHAGDTYFPSDTKFEAWKIQYCLDNDTNRFAWAVADNATGVFDGTAPFTGGHGVIYRMVDEFGNDVPYDFKGLKFLACGDTDNVYRYTFDSGDSSNNTDYSLAGLYWYAFGNKIGMLLEGQLLRLNRIVFKGHCFYNTFGYDCYSNTFGYEIFYNTFGFGCHENTFGNFCYANTFGNHCESNTFGDDCQSNTFGNDCESNTFGNGCYSNTFGNECRYNTFGDYCYSNTFGNQCYTIAFKNDSARKNYVSYVTIESGNHDLDLDLRGTSSDSLPYRNVTVKAGVNDKTIRDDTDGGQTFHTIYTPKDSQVIEL